MTFAALICIFAAGVANFAMHRALVESDDPHVQAMLRPFAEKFGPYASYVFEFGLLLAALLLTERRAVTAIILYGVYTIFNMMAFGWVRNRPR